PNPSNGIFSIQNLGEGISNIAVFNLLGEEMYQSTNNNITIGKQTEIDLSSKPKGIYLIQVTTGKSITNKKIILE
ncbi:MAG: T9SS type A sorting domain-containing protein, partial [Bacteroidota bacterium]